jgi:hypothetical protein
MSPETSITKFECSSIDVESSFVRTGDHLKFELDHSFGESTSTASSFVESMVDVLAKLRAGREAAKAVFESTNGHLRALFG